MNENKTPESQIRAVKKYKEKVKKDVKRITVDFRPVDHDLFEHLNQQPNKQGYIKALIRADMERNK